MKLKVRKVKGIQKYLGLMFRARKTLPILFEFNQDVNIAIHSWFVFFPFKAIWLDEDDKIIEKRIVRPFTSFVKPYKPYRKLIEIPLSPSLRLV